MDGQSKDRRRMPEVDVLVAGGGPAGLAAAVAAARNGVRVILVEGQGFLGGNATAGMVGNFCGFYTTGPLKKRVVGGIGEELLQRLLRQGGAVELVEKGEEGRYGVIPYNHEVLKQVADEMVQEAGVEVWLHTYVVGAVVEEGAVRGVVVENKSGQQVLLAQVVIDATGDGDVAARAGAEYELSQPTQAMTTAFCLAGVDLERARAVSRADLRHLMEEAVASGKYDLPRLDGGYIPVPGMPGVVAVNMTRIGGWCGVEATDLTAAEMEGRQQVVLYADFLRRRVPGFESAFLVSIASHVGVRETRRVMGEQVLTVEDVLGARRSTEAIGRCAWPVEMHDPSSGQTHWAFLPDGATYDIPYRCLVPRRVNGLLVGGRCASATHEAQASLRVIGPCLVMGQAAGTAAALAVCQGKEPRELNVEMLQERL